MRGATDGGGRVRLLMRRTTLLAAVLGAAIVVAVPTSAAAQTEPPPVLDRADVTAFLDRAVPAALSAHHVPGAAVSVVKDGEVLLAKGYGLADVADQDPVTADGTLFQGGSVSKLFTWTALMQLVEQGKVDLDSDVNRYLDFEIPEKYGRPITIADLLTHTSGFEDMNLEMFVKDPADVEPLRDYLTTFMPERIRPPGQVTAYSNYGTSLAAYIVQQVSGEPFSRYVDEHIFMPLGMSNSTFDQPPPATVTARLGWGYEYEDGNFHAKRDWAQAIGAAGIMTTSSDMATFMIAHLQNGRYGDDRVLASTTAQDMHRQHFTNDPRVDGWTWGFMEWTLNGRRAISHGGDTFFYRALVVLLPEQNTGLFLAFNAPGGVEARRQLVQEFMDRYFPAPPAPAITPASGAAERARQYEGTYLSTRHNESTVEKLFALFQGSTITATSAGHLETENFGIGLGQTTAKDEFVETAPGEYRNLAGTDTLLFRRVGEQLQVLEGTNPQEVFIRQSWYQKMPFHLWVLGFCLVVFVSAVVAGPAAATVRRLRHHKRWLSPHDAISTGSRWVAGIASLLALLFVAGFMMLMSSPDIGYGLPATMGILLAIPVLMIAVALVETAAAIAAWVRRAWRLPGRLHYTLIALATGVFVWWLGYWNILFYQPQG